MMTQSDISDVATAIELYYEFALNRFNTLKIQNWSRPTVSFYLRGATAGTATLQKNHIRINPALYIRNKKDMLEQTVPHEVAHLVAWRVFHDKGHQAGWKSVMGHFGLKADRCHTMDVSEVKQAYTRRRFLYNCSCRNDHQLTSQKHAKMISDPHAFICKNCRTFITFSGKNITI